MPRVRPYESQVSSQGDLPRRSAGTQDFGGAGLANLGQGVENLGQGLGQAQRILNEAKARKEVTDAHVSVAELHTALSQRLDESARNWTPDQPPLSETFLSGHVKTALDKLRSVDGDTDRFETEAGASAFQLRATALTSHMTDLTRSIDAKLAGDAAVQQHEKMVATAGNFLQSHPAYFSIKRDEVNSTINDPNGIYGRISALDRQKLVRKAEEKLAIDAVQGFIRKSPNVALKTLQDPNLKHSETYGWMATAIPNEKLAPLIKHAETEVNGLAVDAARAEADANRQRILLARSAETGLIEKIALHMDNPKEPMLSARDVLDSALTELDPEKSKALLSLIRTWSREDPHRPVHTDPSTMRELVRDIHRPDGDPNKLIDNTRIYQAYDKEKLSFQDLKHVNTEFNEARTPDGQKFGQSKEKFITSMAPLIDHSNPMMGKMDRSGKANVYAFEQSVNRKVEEYRKAGKDIYSLFDPDAPDYMGKPERLKPFQKHIMDSIREFSEGMRNAPAPKVEMPEKARKPGETPQQYLDRMKAQ